MAKVGTYLGRKNTGENPLLLFSASSCLPPVGILSR